MSGTRLQSVVGRLETSDPKPTTALGYLHEDDVGDFRIHAVRRGGMGIVYLCSHVSEKEPAAPRFALKTFDERFFFDPDTWHAFETEARTWLIVSGVPFVLPLLGILSCNRKPHLWMPAVPPNNEGDVSLADEIRRNPRGLPAERCLSIALQLSIALVECLRRVPDLIHGDIKADNILLVDDGKPQLADFGAARLASQAQRPPVAQGTSLYMAPECWDEAALQTQSVDIYAFGATLFEMLAGRPPFEADTAEELARMHCEEPARFPARAADNSLEQALQQLALDCLNKGPDERPADASRLFKRLSDTAQAIDPMTYLHDMAVWAKSHGVHESTDWVAMKVQSLIDRRDGEGALQILKQQPAERMMGRLLKLQGTACSLADQDEAALTFFEKYLLLKPCAEERVDCLNEMGLSLKRLGRLAEARKAFELGLESASDDQRVMLGGNYASTLMRLGDMNRAFSILSQLSIENSQSPFIWALLSHALWRKRQLRAAIEAIQKAIQIAPEDGEYRITLARYLMEVPADVPGAIEALVAGFGLGCHSREWVERSLACYILMDDRERVSELVSIVQHQMPEEEGILALKAAREHVRRISNAH